MKSKTNKDTLTPLFTPWGEQLDVDHIWEEYPRPQMKRQHFQTLNGCWDYKIVEIDGDTEEQSIEPGIPFIPDGQIIVPFSPESLLSGAINRNMPRHIMPHEYLWYQRVVMFQDTEYSSTNSNRCILHFGAVDQAADVYINGILVVSHIGGYLPFHADITKFAKEAVCFIQVRVRDESDTSYHSRGKQTLNRGGMFYTAQSGIWQSVWYEWVPEHYVKQMKITPDYDQSKVQVDVISDMPFQTLDLTIQSPVIWKEHTPCPVSDLSPSCAQSDTKFQIIHQKETEDGVITTLEITLSHFHPWTPDSPILYPFILHADEDIIESYFAMRCFTIEPNERGQSSHMCFCLNHSPLFLHGILDQGYWSDGLMTPPCDEAFVFDIELAKSAGFNMIRKHIKVEPLRFYYHCDRLGMLVWQDMVSGGTNYNMPFVCYLPTVFPKIGCQTKDHHYRMFSREEEKGRLAWEKECYDTVEHLYNVPSLAVWVPFNEGWGQFDAQRISDTIKEKDPTRLVDHASGWFDQKAGDFRSVHNYFRKLKVVLDPKRAFVISEYGGYAHHVKDHSSVDSVYGYRKYSSMGDFRTAYDNLIQKQLFPLKEKGLSGAVYTQLSDVEEEVNGLVTYDRKVVKIQS